MSKLGKNAIKANSAILALSLLVANSTHTAQAAAQSLPKQTAVVTYREATVTVEPAVEPYSQILQTPIEDTFVSQEMPSDMSSTSNLLDRTLPETAQTPGEKLSASPLNDSQLSPTLDLADTTLAKPTPSAETATPGSTTEVLEQFDDYSNSLNQITNVTQLSDVSPGDWAYEALRSLVERYGCIAGYPDGTFRGNRATTRYEFAAGLNACLQQVERLIAASTEGFVTREDLETLQRLVAEFEAELATLGTRVDSLEGRVAFLEDHQFSTTTKLNGEVIFAISDFFGDEDANGNDYSGEETVFNDRVRLNFDTSFTGKDRLRVRLQARNTLFGGFDPLRDPPGRNPPGTNITREGALSFANGTNVARSSNEVFLDDLVYSFPIGEAILVQLYANRGNLGDLVSSTLNPLDSEGNGSISRFGQYNPIYYLGQTSAGGGVIIGSAESPLRLSLGYLSEEAQNPGEGAGLFNGNYGAIAQLTFQPSDPFGIAATYVHTYDNDNLRHNTGSIASQLDVNRPLVSNSYGIEASFAFSPQIIVSGWAGYTNAIVLETGGADIWNYGVTLAINDFGREGSTLGLVAGMEPRLTGSDAAVGDLLPSGRREDPNVGFHVEGFYKLAVTDNFSITPGVIWLTAPSHNNNNDDIFIGTVRTTFTF